MSNRKIQKIYFHSDHKDGDETVEHTNFTYQFGARYYVKAISLSDIVMPNSFYNIDARNNALRVREVTNAVNIDITLTPGVYIIGDDDTTEDSFLKALKDALDAESIVQNGAINNEVYDVSINNNTQKIAITTDGGVNLQIDLDDGVTTMNRVLGFHTTVTSGTTLTAEDVFDLSGVPAVYVRATNINTKTRLNGQNSNILAKVFMDTDFGTIVMNNEGKMWENNFHELTEPTRLSSLDIQLTDEDGNELDNNYGRWEATIELML